MSISESQSNPFQPPSVAIPAASSPRRTFGRIWLVPVAALFCGVGMAVLTGASDPLGFGPSWWEPLHGLYVMTGLSAVLTIYVSQSSAFVFSLLRGAVFQVLSWGIYLAGLYFVSGRGLSSSDVEFVYPFAGGSCVGGLVLGLVVMFFRRDRLQAD
ncbi:MAG: hypothetical protein NXI04_29395 [Planctomycetaceae bacterium]|nr:hypothetical protein [Planctomycetaceae bacterium]